MTPAPIELYAKLAQVICEVGSVAKDGTNTHFKYSYTSAEAMLTALRGPLASRGVVLLSSVTAVEDREYQTGGGKASVITTVHVDFTFVDADTGAMHKCAWAGRGDDAADKGLAKAYTNAIKTFLREQFLIPQGDDPEADTATDKRAADRAPSRPAANGSPSTASAKQIGLIHAKAREAQCSSQDLSNAIRLAAGGAVKVFDAPEAADADVQKLLAALPWALVDDVLERVKSMDAVAF